VLTRNQRQEALCRAYMQAVAAKCGLGWSRADQDYGFYLCLHDIITVEQRRAESGHKLDIQAKSTTLAGTHGPFIRYDLEVKNYNDLQLVTKGTPRILVVLVLPSAEADWISQTEKELVLQHCAYWFSLKGREPTSNRRTVRLQIPRANMFSVEALRVIMDRIRRGEEL